MRPVVRGSLFESELRKSLAHVGHSRDNQRVRRNNQRVVWGHTGDTKFPVE